MNNKSITSIMKKSFQKFAPYARLALLVGAVAAGASGLAWRLPSQAKEGTPANGPVRLHVNEQPIAREGRPVVTSFAPVVKKVTLSVVKVYVTTKAKNIPSADFPQME